MPPPEVLVAPVAQRNVPVYSDWVGTIEVRQRRDSSRVQGTC
ncbi:MAG: hypothetical protein U1E86_28545 [Burkholderiaceae bacterium]